MSNYSSLSVANILFNANVKISSSIGSLNQYMINNNLYITSLSSVIYNNSNTVNIYDLNNNLH